MKDLCLILFFSISIACIFPSFAQTTSGDSAIARKFVRRSHTAFNVTLPYRLFKPANYSAAQAYPLVLFLNGGGERGTDDSIHIMTHPNAVVWARDSNQAKNQCFVVAPQCPNVHGLDTQWTYVPWVINNGSWWIDGSYSIAKQAEMRPMKCAIAIVDSLRREFSIDSTRIYVCGMSLGGYGTFDAIMRYPKLFAAAAPMCGGGDSSQAVNLKDVAIWFDVSNDDPTVLPSASRQMAAAFEKIGRPIVYPNLLPGKTTGPNFTHAQMDSLLATRPTLLYSEYSGGNHQGGWRAWWPAWTWPPQYANPDRGTDNPFLVRWMFQQRKPTATNVSTAVSHPVIAAFTPVYQKQCVPGCGKIRLRSGVRPSRVTVYSLSGKSMGTLDKIRALRAGAVIVEIK
jgi:predicted peptidase